MPKKKHIKTYNINKSSAPLIVLSTFIVALGLFLVTRNFTNNLIGGNVLGAKSQKSTKSVKATSVKKNTSPIPLVGDFTPKGNSVIYKNNVNKALTTLQSVAIKEKKLGNTAVSAQIQDVVFTEGDVENTSDVIEAVETRPAWKDLLSPDYKNLGQLRSSLAHNENSIRKLTKTMNLTSDSSLNAQIQAQLHVLTQERQRIINVIDINEDKFSILGWFTKLITGYRSDSITSGSEPIDNEETVTNPQPTVVPTGTQTN